MVQERLRGATLRPRPVVARRRHPAAEVRGGGQEELPNVHGQWRLGEATSRPRPGVVALRSHPAPEARGGGGEEQPEEWWLRGCKRA